MRSKTSLFSRTLFLKNCARFWPIWVLYLIIWVFRMPFFLLARSADRERDLGLSELRFFADVEVLDLGQMGVGMAAAFGLLAAMAVFAYLYNTRSAGMMHALPVRRTGLFITNYLSGLAFMVFPIIVVFCVTLCAEASLGVMNAGALCMWMVVQILLSIFFYSFAVFCAMFTGNVLALPVFYGILNVLVYGMWFLMSEILHLFLFGYNYPGLYEGVRWLTPVMQLGQKMVQTWHYNASGQVAGAVFTGLPTALVYAAIGLLFMVVALMLYRRRQLESAGDVVSVGWVRPVFKYGVAVCAALAGGLLLYSYFGQAFATGLVTMLLFMIPCGVAGYFGAEMLLKKSFRAFEHWKGCIAIVAAVTLCMVAVDMDLVGFTTRVPTADEVVSISFRGPYTRPSDSWDFSNETITDPARISNMIALHHAVVAARKAIGGEEYLHERDGDGYETDRSANVGLTYLLKNGRTVVRGYNLPIDEALLKDENSYASLLTNLLNDPSKTQARYFGSEENQKLVEATLLSYDVEGEQTGNGSVPTEGLEEVLAAVKSDMAAGRLGRRYLLGSRDQKDACYVNEISFGFYQAQTTTEKTAVHGQTSGAAPQAYPATGENVKSTISRRIHVVLQTTATDTIAALEKWGVLDDENILVTQNERWKLERLAEQKLD